MDISTRVCNAQPTQTAQQIIDRFVPEHLRMSRMTKPDHLQRFAGELGIKRLLTRPLNGFQNQDPGVDAMLVPLPNGYSVVINQNAPRTRQLYSLAHELGHIMILETKTCVEEPKRSTRYRSSSTLAREKKAEERLCDEIAAELLMPEKMFGGKMSELGQSLEHLPILARFFGTSMTATGIRFLELLQEPCHLIKWNTSTDRKGFISIPWQLRNKVPGPYLRSVIASTLVKTDNFRELRENWKTFRTSRSYESLLERHVVEGRRHVRTKTFETESIGFGSQSNRTALSAVYLSRIYDENSR